ncbi:MAG: SGNH/GDSL hydrolase family protein [Nitriliruptorales bacterium]
MRRVATLALFGLGLIVAHNSLAVRRIRRVADVHDHSLSLNAIVGNGLDTPLRLVVLGDSYPAGFGLTDPAETYPHQLARRISERTGRPVRVVSKAVRGARTDDVTRTQVPGLDNLRPDVVAVLVGANDALARRTPTRVRRDTTAMLEAIRAAAPGAQLVIGRAADLGDSPVLPWPLSRLVSLASNWTARVQAEVADEVGVPHDRAPRQGPEMFGPDGFHGSAISHALAADMTVAALTLRQGLSG